MPDNAAIYIADPSILGSKLFDQFEGVLSYEHLSRDGFGSGIRFKLDVAEVTMNFMAPERIEEHLRGFSGYASSLISDPDHLTYVLTRISNVRFVLCCVIEPGFDEEGKVQSFLAEFSATLNGLLFLSDMIFDYDGDTLAEPATEDEE